MICKSEECKKVIRRGDKYCVYCGRHQPRMLDHAKWLIVPALVAVLAMAIPFTLMSRGVLHFAEVSRPDLTIQDMTWSPSNPTVGNTVTFTITIGNEGERDAKASTMSYYIDDAYGGDVTVAPIPAGATARAGFTWSAQEGTHTIKAVADSKDDVRELDEDNNEKGVDITPASPTPVIPDDTPKAAPDLIVDGITWSPANPIVGDTVAFTVTVKNQGNADAKASTVHYYVDGADTNTPSSVPSIATGATATGGFNWNAKEGNHAISATADSDNVVAESDETNNQREAAISPSSPPPPSPQSDLIVKSITWSPTDPSAGASVTFTVNISNQGNGDAGAFTVRYYVDDVDTNTPSSVPSLAAGATVSTSFMWNAAENTHKIKAVADSGKAVSESNENNNETEVTVQVLPHGWSKMASGTTEGLNEVWGSVSNDIFAVGNNGTVLQYNTIAWTSMTSGTTNVLNSVWCSASNDVFAVGPGGTILHYNGTWTSMASGTTVNLEGVWGSFSTDVFAVGASGTILHYNGTWSLMASGTTVNLEGVWGISPTDVFAVGASGTILHYDGITWTTMSSGTTFNLESVWGSSSTDVFAVGASGTILHYNGTAWTSTTSGSANLNGVWGSAFNDVFAVGASGTILHYNGTAWTSVYSAASSAFMAIWSGSSTNVFVVGENGIILHYTG